MSRKNKWIGSFMESFLMTLRIFSFLSTVAIIIVLYANIQPFLLRYVPWITLWYFILILAAIGLTGMWLVHKFVLPFTRTIQDTGVNGRLERIEKLLTVLVENKKEDRES